MRIIRNIALYSDPPRWVPFAHSRHYDNVGNVLVERFYQASCIDVNGSYMTCYHTNARWQS
jgi:hypothetical protein